MTTRRIGFAASILVAVLALACGSSGGTGGTTGGGGGTTGGTGGSTTITISNFKFSPDPITVAAGSTITVVNSDSATHSATCEAAAKAYTKGQATAGFTFDTNLIQAGGTATITVPTGIASGTSQPYFCSHHTSGMSNPDPVIKIQ